MKLLDLFCDGEEMKPPSLAENDCLPTVKTRSNNPYITYRQSCCSGYPEQCRNGCPDADLYHYDEAGKPISLKSDFCKRHPRPEGAMLQ